MLSESIKNELLKELSPIDPAKVILFGSYAWGSPTQDSDIDLYIVTKESFIPKTYEDNLQIKKRVYQALEKFRKKIRIRYTGSYIASSSEIYCNGKFFFERNYTKRNLSYLKN
jgi:predicted nucleotidyltransferase